MGNKCISGSRAAAICGVNPWQTPLQAYDEIINQTFINDNPAMWFGRELESVIRRRYEMETGRIVEHNTDTDLFGIPVVHPEYEWMLGSLDGISRNPESALDERVLEIKTARSRDHWADGVPEWYQCQVMHYLACTGLPRADVAVLFGASDFEIYEIERDEELIRVLIAVEKAFLENHLIPEVPPEPSNLEDAAIRWPISIGINIVADDRIGLAAYELKSVKEQIKSLKEQQESLEFAIKNYMQECDTLLVDGCTAVTWKTAKDSQAFDMDRFKVEHAALYQSYLTTKPGSRRFLVK